MRRLLVVSLSLLFAGQVAAQDQAQELELTLAGQGVSSSGNNSQFRELFFGAQPGAFVSLRSLRVNPVSRWKLELYADEASNAWLAARADWGAFRVKLAASSYHAYSTRNRSEDFLPSGTPIDALYPGSGFLAWKTAPSSRTSWADLKLERRWQRTAAYLRLGGRERDGERVPEYGGFSFADNGTPTFYTPGLVWPDSQAGFAETGWHGALGGLSWSVAAGMESSVQREKALLPAYGLSSPLASNGFASKSEVERSWVTVGAQAQALGLGWQLSATANWGTFTPSGSDWLQPSAGEKQPGFSLRGEEGRFQLTSGTFGVVWPISARLRLTLTGQSHHRYQRGSGVLSGLRGQEAVTHRTDTFGEGGKAELVGQWSSVVLRVAARYSSEEKTLREAFRRSSQDATYAVDTWSARAEASLPRLAGLSWRLWTALAKKSYDAKLRALDWGYLPIPDGETAEQVGLLAKKQWGARYFRVTVTAAAGQWDNFAPAFEPVYDPTQLPEGSSGRRFSERATFAGGLGLESHNLGLELGYLRERWYFDASRPFTNFALVNEELQGLLASAFWNWQWQEKLWVSVEGEWVAQRLAMHQNLVRGQVAAAYRLWKEVRVYTRYRYGDLTWPRAKSREFTGQTFALGLQLTQ